MRNLVIQKNVRRLRRFAGQESGSASIEFILTFPLLVLILVGSYVWFDAFRSNSLTSKSAYTIADISSRWGSDPNQPNVTLAEMVELFDAHKRLLPPRVEDGWMRISSICRNTDDILRVHWSYVGDDTLAAALADPDDELVPRLLFLADEDIPTEIIPSMSQNDSVLLVEVFATWTPMVDWVGFAETDWRNRLVSRPRFEAMLPAAAGITENYFTAAGYADAGGASCPVEDDGSGGGGGGGEGDDADDGELGGL